MAGTKRRNREEIEGEQWVGGRGRVVQNGFTNPDKALGCCSIRVDWSQRL